MVAEKSAENTEGGGYSGASLFEGYISEQEYARQRGVSLRTCQRDRALRKSPPHCVLGKQVYYRISAVRAWLLQQERSFTPKPGPARVRGRR
jgi:predicted metal-dependent hydrolase